jgi:hypothetical protein
MAEVLRGRGVDVTLAAIGFTDPRYVGRFQELALLTAMASTCGQ